VIGTRQYRRMENDSTNILRDEELRDIVAAEETGERETNAPNQFEAPRAVEERETNATCQGKTAEDTGAREINVSERETTAEERRRPADYRGPTAVERGFSGQQTTQPNPEGSGCGSRPANSRSGSW
jgi:hypothetical protein